MRWRLAFGELRHIAALRDRDENVIGGAVMVVIFAEAVADCSEAVRYGTEQAEVYFARAVAYSHQGQAERALADVRARRVEELKQRAGAEKIQIVCIRMRAIAKALQQGASPSS